MLDNTPSCEDHRETNGLQPLASEEAEGCECGRDCPVADTCPLRTFGRAWQSVMSDYDREW